MTSRVLHTPRDKDAANKALDIAFRGDTSSIDADMAQLFANEKADLLTALQSILFEDSDKSHKDRLRDRVLARIAIASATGIPS